MFLVSTHHYYCKLIKRASDIHSLMLSSFKDNLSQENSMGTLWNLKTSQKLIYAFAFQWKMENYIVSESYFLVKRLKLNSGARYRNKFKCWYY